MAEDTKEQFEAHVHEMLVNRLKPMLGVADDYQSGQVAESYINDIESRYQGSNSFLHDLPKGEGGVYEYLNRELADRGLTPARATAMIGQVQQDITARYAWNEQQRTEDAVDKGLTEHFRDRKSNSGHTITDGELKKLVAWTEAKYPDKIAAGASLEQALKEPVSADDVAKGRAAMAADLIRARNTPGPNNTPRNDGTLDEKSQGYQRAHGHLLHTDAALGLPPITVHEDTPHLTLNEINESELRDQNTRYGSTFRTPYMEAQVAQTMPSKKGYPLASESAAPPAAPHSAPTAPHSPQAAVHSPQNAAAIPALANVEAKVRLTLTTYLASNGSLNAKEDEQTLERAMGGIENMTKQLRNPHSDVSNTLRNYLNQNGRGTPQQVDTLIANIANDVPATVNTAHTHLPGGRTPTTQRGV